jgi:hypothetical protein
MKKMTIVLVIMCFCLTNVVLLDVNLSRAAVLTELLKMREEGERRGIQSLNILADTMENYGKKKTKEKHRKGTTNS